MNNEEIRIMLDTALKEQQFHVYYQPKYDLHTEMVAGAEALVRWQHPEKGLLKACEFLNLFEEAGMINRLDAFVWGTVCGDIRAWLDKGYPPTAISVNVTGEDLFWDELADVLLNLMDQYQIPSQYLHLEITEEPYLKNPAKTVEIVNQLRKLGFILEIDNFGTNSNSLNMLAEMQVDVLKVDMNFIQQEMEKMTGKSVLNFAMNLAKWNKLIVVAEGVEQAEQIFQLRSMDCDYVQGFYYAKPMPASDFAHILHTSAVADLVGRQECHKNFQPVSRKDRIAQHQKEILIVDDIEVNRGTLAHIFSEQYDIVEMENGLDAWNYLELHHDTVELVLLDLQMPVMDGFELLSKIREHEEMKELPVVITSQLDAEAEQRALEMNADDFISKPYHPGIVRQRVKNVLAGYRLQKMKLQELDEDTEHYLQNQLRYRYIMDNLDVAFFEIGQHGEFYASDKFSLYEMSEESVEHIVNNDGSFSYVYPDDIPILFDFFSKKNKKNSKISATLRLKMRDGTYRFTEMLAFYEYNEQGDRVKSIGVLKDVDQEWLQQNRLLQDALETAEKANQAKTDFLARVSHDMRTPLNGILGITRLMRDSKLDAETRKEIEQLEQSGQYLLHLIDDTLDVGQIEHGNLELHPSVCDGKTAFQNVISMVTPGMKAKNIKFEMQAENLPFTQLYMDVGRVEQAVMNILSNAIKFTPEGGTITFIMKNLSIKGNIITDQITIRDTGIGMSKEFQEKLFEPFSQERNDTRSIYHGTGLGMTICKQCMELMGGSISVKSEEGKGTEVTLILPMQIASEGQIEEWKHANKAVTDDNLLKGKHVLLCEDHPLNAAIAIKLLNRKGVIVEHAMNGQIGVDMFCNSDVGYYDAILMDIRMPIMDGLEATRQIRNLARQDAEYIPIIAMTANAMRDDVKKAINAGMTEHLGKPVEPEKLFKTLVQLIQIPKPYAGKKILIVDDIPMNREFVKKAITGTYQIFEAGNGVEALEVLRKEKDIVGVVTDVQMPLMDGKELIQNIRKDDELRHIAILANTIYGDHRQEDELLRLGANDFVYKPTSARVLMMRLEHILRHV